MRTVASIAPNTAKRLKAPKPTHRPTHPRVTALEGLVDCITALTDDRDIMQSAAKAIAEIGWARYKFEHELRDNDISRNDFLDAFGDLDRLERRISDMLGDRGMRLDTHILPEVKRCYDEVEYAR